MNKLQNKLLVVFILIITYIIINLICENKVYAITQTVSEDINSIDSSQYPKVKELLQNLKNKYPNWNFKILYTDIEWSDAIENEYVGHGNSPRNLVQDKENYKGDWICKICGNKKYDNGNSHCASELAISYMLDPRNSINYSDIFQFMELSYNDCDIQIIKKMVNNTFLNNELYINTIIESAKKYNVNPYYLIARIVQEQKSNGSTLSKGNGYNGQYVGYYNVFNIGANGNTKEEIIINGFEQAKKSGWTSIESSIIGGTEIIAQDYISRGQNTLYFQKFDVENSDGNLYWHQYMQNILAAQSEGSTLRKTFESFGIANLEYTFIIPLYKNMPSSAVSRPSTISSNETTSTDLVKVNVSNTLYLRSEPKKSASKIASVCKDEIITRLSKATEKVDGTYWDYVMKADGTKGYAARQTYDSEKTYKLYLVPVNDDKIGTGDLNGDGKVDSMDMYNIIQYILGNIELSESQIKAVDLNNDNKIDSMDMYLIIQKVLNG